ncbi:MAG: hypothetical protein LUC85_04840 [Bacteroidales bacterium]|nr:hypothetical protein [Bacteroidales bacterium]MCD8394145.1 hypothetical protein [Bacteroidales bacterium]
MKNFLMAIATLVVSVALASCQGDGTARVDDDLATAEVALDEGNPKVAINLCNEILQKADREVFPVSTLGKTSILLMRLSEEVPDDEEEFITQATQCYLKAFATNADSALAYYSSLPIDYARYTAMMAQLSQAITAPAQLLDSAETDSIDSSLLNLEHDHGHGEEQ